MVIGKKVPLIHNFCGLITFNSNHVYPPKSFYGQWHILLSTKKKLELLIINNNLFMQLMSNNSPTLDAKGGVHIYVCKIGIFTIKI